MHAIIWLVPDLIESRIVVLVTTTICNNNSIALLRLEIDLDAIPFDERLPNAAALFPCTSILDDFVKGMRTLQIPMSSSCDLSSSAHDE